MAVLTVSRINRFYRRGGAGSRLPRALALGAALASLAAALPAGAQTTGNGADVTSLGALYTYQNPPGTVIDLSGSLIGFIRNPYIQVVSGISGSFTAAGRTYNAAGMLAFNNVAGSLRYGAADDGAPLAGGRFDVVSPLVGQWENTASGFVSYNYPAYLRAIVDDTTTITPIVTPGSNRFNPDTLILTGLAPLSDNVEIQQEIQLYRATARLRWIIRNGDTVSHTVRLRFAVNGTTPFTSETFFYQDPDRGLSRTAKTYTGAQIPDIFFIYGNRYETAATQGGPLAAKFVFRKTGGGAGAPTLPYRLVVTDSGDFRPNDARFDVNPGGNIESLAVAAYYGPYSLPPGGTAEVLVYYGNGSVSETLDRDYTVAADGPESLGYNTAAALDPSIAGKVGFDPLAAASLFLAPNPFQIYAGVYNRVPNTPSNTVSLTNTRASVTLPKGLAFAAPSGSTVVDTAEKQINSTGDGAGVIAGDRGADAPFNVRATGEVYGALTYQVNVKTNEAGSRQISRVINVPATPYRPLPTINFQMLGIPFDFDPLLSNNGDPATVLNALAVNDATAPVIKTWVPDPNSANGAGFYTDVTTLENGVGYFYKPNAGRAYVFAKGVKPLANQAPVAGTNFADSKPKQLALTRGWNLISNPYVYEIPLRYLRFATNNVINDAISFQDGANSGLIGSAGLYFLNPATNSYDYFYRPDVPLKPWEGYWIFVTRNVTLVYQLPVQRNSVVLPTSSGNEPATRAVRGELASGRAMNVAAQTADDWRLQLVATREGGKSDQAALIGVSASSKDGDTTLTSLKPPTPFNDYVYTTLIKSDKEAPLAKDIRRSASAEQSWTLDVASDSSGKVTLSWPGASRLPRRLKLTLKDSETGRSYSMRSQSSVTVNVGKDKSSRFVVTAKTAASTPLSISGLRVTSTRGAGRTFVFNMSREASVTAKVTTLSGKVVANLASGRAVSAGENRLHWSSRAESGAALPPGPYLVEIMARDGDGEIAPARQPFMMIE